MNRGWVRKALCTGVMLPLAALLAGCPLPLPPGYAASSRENLDAGVTGRLVAGVSTREEVLLLLGEPDGVGPEGSWLAYGSAYGRGGVVFVMCAGNGCGGGGSEKMEYRRLVVSFDERGLMMDANFVSRECWEDVIAMGGVGGRSQPCIQIDAPESTARTNAASAKREALYQQGEIPIPKDLLAFASGKAELLTPGWTTGFEAAAAAGKHTELTKRLHASGEWEALARAVLNDNYGDNLRWYYLGRAAEGMALCDTAVRYYGISRERSKRFSTRCWSVACAGIKLPDTLGDRLGAVEEMRAAGKCPAPAKQGASR